MSESAVWYFSWYHNHYILCAVWGSVEENFQMQWYHQMKQFNIRLRSISKVYIIMLRNNWNQDWDVTAVKLYNVTDMRTRTLRDFRPALTLIRLHVSALKAKTCGAPQGYWGNKCVLFCVCLLLMFLFFTYIRKSSDLTVFMCELSRLSLSM